MKKEKRGTQEMTLRNPQEITLENISHYEWEVFRRVSELVDTLKKDQKDIQPDNTTVRAGKLVVVRGRGYPRPTPDFEAIWGILDKAVYAPKKQTRGAIRIDFLG